MEPKIVEAVGTIVISTNAARKSQLQAAMVKAVLDCMAEGITDPDVIRTRQLAAKERMNGRL